MPAALTPRRSAHPHAAWRTRVLLTGFGPFPGVPVNATMQLVPELHALAASAFPDIAIMSEILPTEWQAAPQRLAALLAAFKPHLAIHFGVSARARGFEVERRARNACSPTPDASGALPASDAVHDNGAEFLSAGLPVQHIVARLRRRGIPAFVSHDAGAYLCNCVLYHSLAETGGMPSRRSGFIHVPASLAGTSRLNRGRSGPSPLTWAQAVDGGLEIVAACLGRALAPGVAAHAR